MRKHIAALIVAGTAVAGMIVAPNAQAAPGDTVTSFELEGGSLSISVPGSAELTGTTTAVGAVTLGGQLGAVTVTDNRGLLVAAWTASVDGGSFTTGGGSPAETVTDDKISYWSGAASKTGNGAATGQQLLSAAAVTLAAQRSAVIGAFVGNNTGTWNPTLIVNVPAGNVAGEYSGTITHSVA